jgi:dihydrofolate reductase
MTISIIAALSKNNVIGVNNKLPWHIPDDLKRVKKLTTGKPIIMGCKTFTSIGKPLPNRHNIIISSDEKLRIEGCDIANSLEQALDLASYAPEIMVFGGAQVYQQALPKVSRMYLTLVDSDIEGDTYFPEWNIKDWEIKSKTEHETTENLHYAYLELERKLIKLPE